MRKREYLGQLELMVLLAVIRPANDAYGVLIAREIAEKSGREVALASVYAALERLEKKQLVTAALGEPTALRGGPRANILQAHRGGSQGGEGGTRDAAAAVERSVDLGRRNCMMQRTPPPLALWLLKHWGSAYHRESLEGDLMEQFQEGRSRTWYWQQVGAAILIAQGRILRALPWAAVTRVLFRCLAEAAAAIALLAVADRARRTHSFAELMSGSFTATLAHADRRWPRSACWC